jgi:Tol biopolymer transport system component
MMETYPEWSPDGEYLYFCRALQLPAGSFNGHFREIRYDLVRIRYDRQKNSWGDLERIFCAESSGLSAALPRISPDGRYVLMSVMPYGTFTAFRPGGELILYDLRKRTWHPINGNSPQPESFHSWSGNSRWFVFMSKRLDGIRGVPCIAHVDTNGVTSKPFMLPQSDPGRYLRDFITYNLPELIRAPFPYSPRQIIRTAYDSKRTRNAKLDSLIAGR